ncbi:RHS repeat domain-containing protein [Capnocytophaga sp. ARDL2]|uniref:RHS repeat domain-containing protein n=1 Tax=Capnocytophaga sp. ARDL2 TaxID=3238809 RepID=UPI00355738AA
MIGLKMFTTQGKIYYLYDATGKRIQKRIQPNQGAVVITDYFGEFQYENGILQFFAQPEGYVKPHNGAFLYVYQYKDHLGNIRLSYADVNDNGVIEPASEILEESNYYPFGLKHQGYNEITNVNKSIAAEKYKFGGKEWNDELGLNLYDFHARNYDAAIGRTTTYDPMAEEFYRLSPQSFLNNNPINFVDPTGMVAFPADSYGRNLLMTGAAFNFSYFGEEQFKGEGVENDYQLDRESGRITLVNKTDDNFDRLIEKKDDNNEKVIIDNIPKGILRNGLNLKTIDNSFIVNLPGTPSIEDFNRFISRFTDYIKTEIAGIRLGNETSNPNVYEVITYKYKNNTRDYSQTPEEWLKITFGKRLKSSFSHASFL